MSEDSSEKDAKGEPAPAPAPSQQQSSVATRASCLTFVFLVIAAVTTWIYLFFFNPDSISFFTAQGWLRLILVFLLILVIPIAVFRTITLWMMRESSRYPDVNYAWQAGIAALAEHGMSLRSAPIFLILGTGDDRTRRNFMHAAGYEFRVNNVPEGPAPLHWYANPDAIYIVLGDVCWLQAASAVTKPSGRPVPSEQPRRGATSADLRGTLVPGEPSEGSSDRESPSDGGASSSEPPRAPATVSPPSEVDPALLRGTMVPGTQPTRMPTPTPAARRAPRHITSQTSTQLLRRLQHVCSLIRQSRHPVCPINGILMLLPFEALLNTEFDIEELERAIAADLSVAQRELQLRSPVTAAVTGMERERGFRELIRRVGQQRATRQRFGQRFDLRTVPTVLELERFTSHVCGTFEDWVYTQFRETDALSRTGNPLLFALLCRVRRSVGTRLKLVLGAGFGWDETRPDAPNIFSGCYFAATGPRGDRQAFVRGLFDKLSDEQEEIEWTDTAIRDDRRNRLLTRVGWLISILLLSAIIGLFIFNRISEAG